MKHFINTGQVLWVICPKENVPNIEVETEITPNVLMMHVMVSGRIQHNQIASGNTIYLSDFKSDVTGYVDDRR